MESQDDLLTEFVISMDEKFSHLLSETLNGNHQDQLWELLCDEIENGDLNKKLRCLRLTEVLINTEHWPGVWTFYLIDILFALYELITEKAKNLGEINGFAAVGAQLSSLLVGIGSSLQGDLARILQTPFVDATPSKLVQWYLRCNDVVTVDNFVALSVELQRGVLEFFRGVCIMLCVYDDGDLRDFTLQLSMAIQRFCCHCNFFRYGDRRLVLEFLRLFIEISGKICPPTEENGDFYRRLKGFMKSNPANTVTLATLLGDAVPYDDSVVSNLPMVLLSAIGELYGIIFRQFYSEFAGRIVKRCIKRLINCVDATPGNVHLKIVSYFEQATFLFGYKSANGSGADVEYWLTKSMKHIIPCLMLSPSAAASAIHKTVSRLCGTNRHNLISENIRYILVKLALRDMDEDESKAIYVFIESEGTATKDGQEVQYSFSQYVALDLFQCVYELLMHLAASKDRIVDVLARVYHNLADQHVRHVDGAAENERRVVEFVRPRLLGVLSRFTRKFVGRDPFDEKLMALRSLSVLMEMSAGEVVSEVSLKMMSTLRAAATNGDSRIRVHVASAWRVFLSSVLPATMREVALPVFVAVTPMLTGQPTNDEKAVLEPLLAFLFVEQRENLQMQIADISFLSSIIDSALLSNFCPIFDDSAHTLKELLSIGLRLAQIEHPDAKRLSLERLKVLLRVRSKELYKLILDSVSADDVICRVVDTLVSALQHSDVNVRHLAAVCMGHLGAIDPGRLRSSPLPSSSSTSRSDVVVVDFVADQSPEFPCLLLCEVTRLLLGASSESFYDVCSCTLQEILSFYKCREGTDKKGTLANSVWSQLDDATKKILTPFLSSNYKLGDRQIETDPLPHPLLGSTAGTNFKQWITTWISALISQAENTPAKELFSTLKVVARNDVGFAQFLLPHVVLQRLREGSEDECRKLLDETYAALVGESGPEKSISDVNFERCSAHVVFRVLDFLYKWTLKTLNADIAASGRSTVDRFIIALPKEKMSMRAFAFGVYPRALMYYETYMSSHQTDENLCTDLRHLQEIYAKLNDVDGVVGSLAVLKKAGQGVGKDKVLALEAAGNYAEALPFWEAASSSEHGDSEENVKTHVRLVNCLLRLNQASVCERYLSDLSRTNSEWEGALHPFRVEALLKLQQWDKLEKELNEHPNVSRCWASDVGNLLLTARTSPFNEAFNQNRDAAIDHVVNKLSVASRDSGTCDGGYKYMLRLHMLSEIEQGAKQLEDEKQSGSATSLDEMIFEWNLRFKIVQPSMEVSYALLDLRKQILRLGASSEKRDKAVGACWLEAAKVARKIGHYQSAWSFLVKAKEFGLVETFVEEAKLLWNKDEKVEAISCLKSGLQKNFSDLLIATPNYSEISDERRFLFAKAQLSYANYCRESASMETMQLSNLYHHLISNEIVPRWEEAHYYAAFHYDQTTYSRNSTASPSPTAAITVLETYAKSLEFGSRYVHHAMPRLLTLWLDTSNQLYFRYVKPSTGVAANVLRQAEDIIQKMNELMSRSFGRIPAYQFYCCFSQLMSRICHPCKATYQVLKEILAGLLAQYPRQCVWMMISVKRSSVPERNQRCKEIVQLACEKNPSVEAIFASVDRLAELLIGVCERSVENSTTTLSLKRDFRQLFDFFSKNGKNGDTSQVILPLQKFMDVTFPESTPDHPQSLNHMPFNEKPVYIHEFLEGVMVFPTMQKPKRISLVGTDGRQYSMLCKARDDLRLDKRLMEFTNLVNSCMLRDPEGRRRALHIRTYTVTPLSEKCGLLEWVFNLDAMRNAYIRLCREYGIRFPSPSEIAPYKCKQSDPLDKKLKNLQHHLIPKHPLLLRYWFSRTFPDPMAWYTARTNFVRTAAVMSMVGFVLGLGDRHGENILLDRTSGDVVHVDFNCLFNRGESLEVPEVVPFRLTRNMVDAMGPLGYEGPFRRTCEVVMKLMRSESPMLRSVLETFLYDPLVEWQSGNSAGSSKTKPRPEAGEEKAKSHLNNIELRLQGRVKPSLDGPYGLPLSVEGQVNVLIQQATDPKLLAQMYIGWGPFI